MGYLLKTNPAAYAQLHKKHADLIEDLLFRFYLEAVSAQSNDALHRAELAAQFLPSEGKNKVLMIIEDRRTGNACRVTNATTAAWIKSKDVRDLSRDREALDFIESHRQPLEKFL